MFKYLIDWFKPGIILDSETKYEVDEVDTDPLAIPGELNQVNIIIGKYIQYLHLPPPPPPWGVVVVVGDILHCIVMQAVG